MSADNQQPAADILDRATNALRDAQVLDAPPRRYVDRALEATLGSAVSIAVQPTSRRSRLARIVGTAMAAAVLAAVVGVAWFASRGGSSAFVQAAEKLHAARSLSYDSLLRMVSDGKKREFKSRNCYMEPGKLRAELEMTVEGGETKSGGYVVMDLPAGKALMVSTETKSAIISSIKGGEGKDMARKEIDYIRSLREKVPQARPLGQKQIAGVAAKGFEIVDGKEQTQVWVDPRTGDPLQIEIRQDSSEGPMVTEITKLKLNPDLDPQLFTLTPPEGFTVKPFMAIDMNTTPPEWVADLLRIYAAHFDGQFPAELDKAVKSLAAKLPKPPEGQPPPDEYMEIAMKGAAVRAVTINKKQGEDWQYYPGVKLGEKDRIVFWYHDKKKNTYSALYGDLHVEQVDRAKLPTSGK